MRKTTAISRTYGSSDSLNYFAIDLINIKENFSDLMQIYSFLDDVVSNVLKFDQINKPTLIPYYHGKVEQDCGVSCYTFLYGGYVTFHIFEKRRLAYFDIVSDKLFDIDKVIKFVSQICETANYNVYTNKTKNIVCNENVFGPHYVASGRLYKEMNIDQLLILQDKIIKEIDMTPIINPVVVKDGEVIRLFIAIAESHLSLTVNKNQLRVDLFSCRMFDINKLTNILTSVMEISDKILFTRQNKQLLQA